MDTLYVVLTFIIAIVSIFLILWFANERRYLKTCVRCEEHEKRFWKETALLYQEQINEAQRRYSNVLNELFARV